jgi:hypothetical protein
MQTKYHAAGMSHIIDDFLFVGPPNSDKSLHDLNSFLQLCNRIGIPIKAEKTVLHTFMVKSIRRRRKALPGETTRQAKLSKPMRDCRSSSFIFSAGMSHIIDDFLFVGPPNSDKSLHDLNSFLQLCNRIGIPIKAEKTRQAKLSKPMRDCRSSSFIFLRLYVLLRALRILTILSKYHAAGMSHIIDDFLFVGPPNSDKSLHDLNSFLQLCNRTCETK